MSTQSRGRTGTSSATATDAAAPERLGRYRIIRLLGEGGMGVVYLAEQDEPVRREVALKVLRAGSASEHVLARFASERQALAMMEHPNITRVFDAGLTPAGLPYFVMERVVGVPINEYAAAHRLSTRDRAALFVQVCRAVQHAHQKGIIHRDLKPSNVLVTDNDGAPLCKVIDFGIAKATGPVDLGARLTATGMWVGTPAYMSPEQLMAHADDIDTRTDIYSLGVLLYELLAGSLPGANGGTPSWGALMRRAEGGLPPASAEFGALSPETRLIYAAERGTDPDALRRSLRGDLDSILTKALETDRERRYATAAAFADDIERHLANQPIIARGASRAYRAGKFVRRHRAGVVLAAMLFLVLVATAIGASVQARRLSAARWAAVSRQQQGDSLIGFMLGDLSTKLRPIGRLDLLEDVDRKLLAYFSAVPSYMLSDPERLRRAESLRQLGEIRHEQGRLDDASALLFQSLRLARELVARDSSDVASQLQLVHSEYSAGDLAWRQGRNDEALQHFVPFDRVSERLVRRFPDSLDYQAQRAYVLNNIGVITEAKGDARAALRSYDTARTILSSLVARDSSVRDWRVAVGNVLNVSGEALRKTGDLEGSLTAHRKELAIRSHLSAADTTDVDLRRAVAITHIFLGELHEWRGALDSSITQLRQARRTFAELVARDTANVGFLLTLAGVDRRLGLVALERGDLAGALASLGTARAALARILARAPANVRAMRELATVRTLTARTHLASHRVADALSDARAAVAVGDSALVVHPDDVEWARRASDASLVLGDVLHASGDDAYAATAWSHALVLATPAGPAANQTDFVALRSLALQRLGRDAEAAAARDELARRGVRRPSLVLAARERGASSP